MSLYHNIFGTLLLNKVLSRVCVVPFVKPSVDPETEKQHDAYDDIEEILKTNVLSSLIGWVITIGNILCDKGVIKSVKDDLRRHFKGRGFTNWSLLLTCARQER